MVPKPTPRDWRPHGDYRVLNQVISDSGVVPQPNKVEAVQGFSQPTAKRQLREFLRLVNFYHRFIPHCAHIHQPLHDLLATSRNGSDTLSWSQEAKEAFREVKHALANAALLDYPRSGVLQNVDFPALAAAQRDDDELKHLLTATTALNIERIPIPASEEKHWEHSALQILAFDHVHLDIVCPLPPYHGQAYLLTCVDRFTRWAEAIPIVDMTAETVASAFLYHWVARFEVPSTVTIDYGRQFESALFTAISQLMGPSRIRTTAYYPMSNGMVKRFHRQLKAALTATEEQNWVNALPLVLLGIRSTLKEDIGCSAAELVYGTTLRLPGEFFASGSEEAFIAYRDYALRLRNVMSKLCAV
nr:uncharacterized protein LOC119173389 [Rhipicephalus microplus]